MLLFHIEPKISTQTEAIGQATRERQQMFTELLFERCDLNSQLDERGCRISQVDDRI